jgi:tetratricopeptide (TPR) repeat protein
MRLFLLRLLIVAATLGTFAYLISCNFTEWDDPQTVSQNHRLHPPTLHSIRYYWTAAGAQAPMGLYIPVTYTFWSIIAAISRNAAFFHAANILLHMMAALAMFELLRVLIRHDWAACAGALLFALHPVQVESVAWVSGTKDLLCGLFSLVALWQYTLYAEQRPHKHRHYAIGLLCLILAMLSKPTAIVVPLMAVAIDLFFLRRQRRVVLKSLWLWLALMIPCAIWTMQSQPQTWTTSLALWVRPAIAADAVAFYLYKLVLPINLCVDYGHRPQVVLSHGWIYFTWTIPLVIAIAALLLRRRKPAGLTAGLLFLLPLFPVLGLTPFEFQLYSTTADHYLYLAMLGPAFLLGSLLSRHTSRFAALITAAILVVLAAKTILQEPTWQNTQTLFEHTLNVNPDSFAAWNMLGYVHSRLGHEQNSPHEFQIAADCYARSIAINDLYIPSHFNFAIALRELNRTSEARQQIQHIVDLQPILPPAMKADPISLAEKLVAFGDPAGAVRWLDMVLQADPNNFSAARLRAQIAQSDNPSPTSAP